MKQGLLGWMPAFCLMSGAVMAEDIEVAPVQASSADAASQARPCLDLVIAHLGEGDGPVRISIETEESWFVDDAESYRTFTLPRTAESEVSLRIEDLPEGEYAIRVFHDEDGDNELNRRFYGPPREPYGFSGKKTDRMLPKSFDYAKFHFDKPMTMTITLRG